MVTRLYPPYSFGGGIIQAIFLAEKLCELGVKVGFLVDNGPKQSETTYDKGFNVHKIKTFLPMFSTLGNVIYTLRLLIFVIRNPEYKCLHFHSISGYEAFLFPLFKMLGIKIILKLTLMDSDDPIAFGRRKLGVFIRWGMTFADKIIAISTALLERCREAKLASHKYTYIPNGVDNKLFYEPTGHTKKLIISKNNLSGYTSIFLAVGKVEVRKGYEFMINAWYLISSSIPGSVLLIVGPGNDQNNAYYNNLQSLIHQKEINNVIFLGQRQDINELMSIATYVIHCSTAEGLPNTLLEAAFSKVPIVCKRIHGVTSDILLDESIGYESVSQSPEEFAKDAISYISRPKIRTAHIDQVIAKKFSMDTVAAQYCELYDQLESIER